MNRMREIISIHVPNAGNDGLSGMANYIVKEFQSTFPMQGTTNRVQRLILRQGISIHVPNAGNDSKHIQISILNNIIFVTYYGFLLMSFPL